MAGARCMLGKRIRGGQVEGRDFLMGAKEWGREDMSRVGRHARVVPLDMAEREGGGGSVCWVRFVRLEIETLPACITEAKR